MPSGVQPLTERDSKPIPVSRQEESKLKADHDGLWERIRLSLSVESAPEAARMLGLSKQSVYDWQKGTLPSIETLLRICESGNTSLHWLVTGQGPRQISPLDLPKGEAPIYFGEREHQIIQKLADESGRGFDSEVRELVLETLLARGLVKDQVKGANLEFFGDFVPKLVPIRLWGEIAAGKPIDIFEQDEEVLVPEEFVVRGRDHMVLRVRGDSMEEDGVVEGDLIIGVSTSSANNGDLVVALIDGDQSTVKRFYRERDKIRLEPRNQAHEPMYFAPERVTIQGIVRGIFRRTL